MMLSVAVLDQVAGDVDQAIDGMILVTLGFIQKSCTHFGHLQAVHFVPYRAVSVAQRKCVQTASRLYFDGCIHDFLVLLS